MHDTLKNRKISSTNQHMYILWLVCVILWWMFHLLSSRRGKEVVWSDCNMARQEPVCHAGQITSGNVHVQ